MQGPATQAMEDTGLKKIQIDEGSIQRSNLQEHLGPSEAGSSVEGLRTAARMTVAG